MNTENNMPAPAGPVWVSYDPNKPLNPKEKFYTKYCEGDNREVLTGLQIGDLYMRGWYDIEYLDESTPAQQVFSRDEVFKMIQEYIFYRQPDISPDTAEMLNWFNTNYPPLK